MKTFLLSTTAAFAPPDDLGGGADVSVASETIEPAGAGEGLDGGHQEQVTVQQEDQSQFKNESAKDSIRRAMKELKGEKPVKAKPASGKAQDGAVSGDAAQGNSAETEGNTGAPQAQSEAPKSWKAEEKALWNGLPDNVKAIIHRREADTERGVQAVRQKYQEIDAAVAPYAAVMKQNNVTAGQAINQLFKWHMELAGPNKVQAFKQLAQNFGIDPATLATAGQQASQAGQEIPDNLRPVIQDLQSRLQGYEQNFEAHNRAAAEQTWANWSKDKTHAETVRGLMAQLINGDLAMIQAGQPQVSNTIKNGNIDMDAAYQAAIYAHPEVRKLVLQEEEATRQKAAKAAATKAKNASVSMRNGAPAAPLQPKDGSQNRNESPKDSVRRALAELRTR